MHSVELINIEYHSRLLHIIHLHSSNKTSFEIFTVAVPGFFLGSRNFNFPFPFSSSPLRKNSKFYGGIWPLCPYAYYTFDLKTNVYLLGICTFLRRRPWEIDSHIMNADTRCWTGPASPQWGRNTNVFNPLSLKFIFF